MAWTKELFAAAKIIRTEGIVGVHEASLIVGRDVALGMLIVFLSREWPITYGGAEKVLEEIFKRENLLNVIEFSPMLGRGVVFDGDVAMYVIDIENMYEPKSAKGVHLGMWLQGPGDIRIVPAEKFPYRKVYDEMLQAHQGVIKTVLGK